MNEWIFTFCYGGKLGGHCVRVQGDYGQAREKMVAEYGTEWAFQYSAEEWEAMKIDPHRAWVMETEVPFGSH